MSDEPLAGFDACVDLAYKRGPRATVRVIQQLGAMALLNGVDLDKVDRWVRSSHERTSTVSFNRETKRYEPDRDVSRAFSGAVGMELGITVLDHAEADLEERRLHRYDLNPYFAGPYDRDRVGVLGPSRWGPEDCYEISLRGRDPWIPKQSRNGIDAALRIMAPRIRLAQWERAHRSNFDELCLRTVQLLGRPEYKDADLALARNWGLDFALQQTSSISTGFYEWVRTAVKMPEFNRWTEAEHFQDVADEQLIPMFEIASTYRAAMQHGLMNIQSKFGAAHRIRSRPKATGVMIVRDASTPSGWRAFVPGMVVRARHEGQCPAQPFDPTQDSELLKRLADYGPWFQPGQTPIAYLAKAVVLCCAEEICADHGVFGDTIGMSAAGIKPLRAALLLRGSRREPQPHFGTAVAGAWAMERHNVQYDATRIQRTDPTEGLDIDAAFREMTAELDEPINDAVMGLALSH